MNGLVHFYYGYGKGKTTAAFGLALRACGRGRKVLAAQFLKNNDSGELTAMKGQSLFTLLQGEPVRKFLFAMTDEERRRTLADQRELFERTAAELGNAGFDMVMLDELGDLVGTGAVTHGDVEALIESNAGRAEIVITGHEADEKLIELADYVTEMKKIKHPYDKGVKSRAGIED